MLCEKLIGKGGIEFTLIGIIVVIIYCYKQGPARNLQEQPSHSAHLCFLPSPLLLLSVSFTLPYLFSCLSLTLCAPPVPTVTPLFFSSPPHPFSLFLFPSVLLSPPPQSLTWIPLQQTNKIFCYKTVMGDQWALCSPRTVLLE